MKTKLLATGVAAILGSAAMVTTTAVPTIAAPIATTMTMQLAPADQTDVTAAQYRRRGPGPYRYHRRGNPGGAIAAGVALGILGTAIIANQPRHYDDPYYEAPPPRYAPRAYEYYEEAPPPRRVKRSCYAPDNNGRKVWVPCP